MPIYQYKAMDRMGQAVQGQIEAATQQSAIAVLAEKGHFVEEIVPRVYTSATAKPRQMYQTVSFASTIWLIGFAKQTV